jgi:hypothetical protein
MTPSRTDCKPQEDPLDSTRYPTLTDLPIVDCRGLEELLEGIQEEVEKSLDDWEIRKAIYGPLDLTKVKLSKVTLRHYLRQEKAKLGRKRRGKKTSGKKHYRSKRLAMRIKNYNRLDELHELQGSYRQTFWGRYVFRRKKAKEAGVPFHLTYEEFETIHVNLGMRPDTNLPWWKYLGSDKRYSLQMSRIDKKLGWGVSNIEFKYREAHVAFARDLINAVEPNLTEAV